MYKCRFGYSFDWFILINHCGAWLFYILKWKHINEETDFILTPEEWNGPPISASHYLSSSSSYPLPPNARIADVLPHLSSIWRTHWKEPCSDKDGREVSTAQDLVWVIGKPGAVRVSRCNLLCGPVSSHVAHLCPHSPPPPHILVLVKWCIVQAVFLPSRWYHYSNVPPCLENIIHTHTYIYYIIFIWC